MKYATRMLAIVVTLMPLLASAQLSTNGMVAKVPFQFRAGNTVIPAGQCDVQRAGLDPRTLLIRNSSGKVALFTMARTVSATKGSSGNALIFSRLGYGATEGIIVSFAMRLSEMASALLGLLALAYLHFQEPAEVETRVTPLRRYSGRRSRL